MRGDSSVSTNEERKHVNETERGASGAHRESAGQDKRRDAHGVSAGQASEQKDEHDQERMDEMRDVPRYEVGEKDVKHIDRVSEKDWRRLAQKGTMEPDHYQELDVDRIVYDEHDRYWDIDHGYDQEKDHEIHHMAKEHDQHRDEDYQYDHKVVPMDEEHARDWGYAHDRDLEFDKEVRKKSKKNLYEKNGWNREKNCGCDRDVDHRDRHASKHRYDDRDSVNRHRYQEFEHDHSGLGKYSKDDEKHYREWDEGYGQDRYQADDEKHGRDWGMSYGRDRDVDYRDSSEREHAGKFDKKRRRRVKGVCRQRKAR
jgi:hypothetical protein